MPPVEAGGSCRLGWLHFRFPATSTVEQLPEDGSAAFGQALIPSSCRVPRRILTSMSML